MMLALLFTPHDFDRALRRRRLAALGLMALGALGCLCYILLPWDGGILPDYARGFYLGASCGIALAGVALLFRAQHLLTHPQARKQAQIKEQDERERAIFLQSFYLAGLVTFYLCAAALLVTVAVNRTAAIVLMGVMAVYAAACLPVCPVLCIQATVRGRRTPWNRATLLSQRLFGRRRRRSCRRS